MFYTFCQNNSFGRFTEPAEVVIIEADSADEANHLAQEYYGLYFDGCESGEDCPCCGDRWYPVDESEGEEFPEYYGKNVYDLKRLDGRENVDGIFVKRFLVVPKKGKEDRFIADTFEHRV